MTAIVLYCPQIPPNTGNIIRLAANSGADLHLVEPLGFPWQDKHLKRAGLDYHEFARVLRHPNWEACKSVLLAENSNRRFFAISTKGKTRFDTPQFLPDDIFVFGQETAGLPVEIMAEFKEENRLRIPMQENQRSLNLSNAVAILVFEAWRQNGFLGGN